MQKIELVTSLPIQLIKRGESQFLQGYAAVWFNPQDQGTEYRPLPNVRERVSPTAFDEVVEKVNRGEETVELWWNHNEDDAIDSTQGGLKLELDNRGLRFESELGNNIDLLRMAGKIERKVAKGCSFQGYAETSMKKEGDFFIRTIEKITKLVEVSVVRSPAYKATEALVRSCHDWEETYQRILRSKAL